MPPATELPAAPDTRPTITADDLATLAGLPALLSLAWLLPSAWWPRFCRTVAPLAVPMVAKRPAAFRAAVAQTLGAEAAGLAPDTILHALAAEHILSLLQLLRDYRPGGWRPAIRYDGLAHLEAAFATGRGVVLWVGYGAAGDLAAKLALHRLGLAVHHLSRPSHGFSNSRFAVRWLNRVQTVAEDRYLGARIALDPTSPAPALASLAAELARGGVVSLTARADARRPIEVPFLAGRLMLAPGAPALAHRTGAALVPVFARREAADGVRVSFAPAIAMPPETEAKAAVEAACRRYARNLEPFARDHPGQWRGWLQL